MRRGRAVRFPDGTCGWVVKTSKTRRQSREALKYIEFMFEKLLEWLDDDEVWYEDFDEMLEDAEDYIYEKLWHAPEDLTPCDGGSPSVGIFVDYIFNSKLWSDSDIADTLLGWRFEPEDIEEMRYVVSCYEELLKFRDALKSIKVKVREVETGEG